MFLNFYILFILLKYFFNFIYYEYLNILYLLNFKITDLKTNYLLYN